MQERRETDVDVDRARYRRAFEIADELNVHGSGCVCPRCAGRLPHLLVQLSAALDRSAENSSG